MVDVQLLNRLRALAARKRWMMGLAVGARCRTMSAALVAVEGSGLSSRVEVAAHRRVALAPELARWFRRLRARQKSPASAALFAARLAEAQATLLDDFAAEVAPVWDRVSAVAVDGPALWHRAGGLAGCLHLCDAARLAEMTGQNVIDGFAARDLAADGSGRPLLPIPYWILLHDAQRTRVLVEVGRQARLTYLPASRDASGAARVTCVRVATSSAEAVERALATLPQMPRIEEVVICDLRGEPTLAEELAARCRPAQVVATSNLGIAAAALKSAAVGVLGLLNLDHTPASLCGATGARTPRVLGRLTPGSLVHWHHLVRELAAARPSVVALRSAI